MPLQKHRGCFASVLAVSLLVSAVLLLHFHGSEWMPSLARGSRVHVEGARNEAETESHWRKLEVAKVARKPPDLPANGTNLNASLPGRQCAPKTSIAFFKMHKCSSSTVQNILFRYGERHQLDFVLPPRGNFLGSSDRVFYRGDMLNFPVSRYNILCHHTRFSHKGMQNVLAKDAVFTTIIRDPVTMFESLFTYVHMASWYGLPQGKGLELFLENPGFYYNKTHGLKCMARNPMLFDLGLDESFLEDEVRVRWKIENLRRQLHLVMITEYFEESLVLLKHLMCWDTDDIVYFILNARSKPSVQPVSPDMAAKIRRWNFGDVALYDAFNRTFWKKVAAFGHDRMRREVAELRERNKYFRDHCIARVVTSDSTVWRPHGIDIDSFQLRPEAQGDEMCVQMARTELPYSNHIKEIQLARYGMPKQN